MYKHLKFTIYTSGSESTQDEFGACAMITTRMDDELGGLPVQYRETQGNESSTFLGYFKPAIHYKVCLTFTFLFFI